MAAKPSDQAFPVQTPENTEESTDRECRFAAESVDVTKGYATLLEPISSVNSAPCEPKSEEQAFSGAEKVNVTRDGWLTELVTGIVAVAMGVTPPRAPRNCRAMMRRGGKYAASPSHTSPRVAGFATEDQAVQKFTKLEINLHGELQSALRELISTREDRDFWESQFQGRSEMRDAIQAAALDARDERIKDLTNEREKLQTELTNAVKVVELRCDVCAKKTIELECVKDMLKKELEASELAAADLRAEVQGLREQLKARTYGRAVGS